jgi:hypothetical protein
VLQVAKKEGARRSPDLTGTSTCTICTSLERYYYVLSTILQGIKLLNLVPVLPIVPVIDSLHPLLINCFYFFDSFLRKDTSPTFRSRMRVDGCVPSLRAQRVSARPPPGVRGATSGNVASIARGWQIYAHGGCAPQLETPPPRRALQAIACAARPPQDPTRPPPPAAEVLYIVGYKFGPSEGVLKWGCPDPPEWTE